ncbi:MAG: hypothetical protein C5B50_04645 [Verrucomicrobia bacterium]|nr:MAG: hypothetical protein C5B50_04645 [Verrucomicrobiota bacterium]
MSKAELKRIVDDASEEEQHFLFVCLSEKLYPHSAGEMEEMDQRLEDLKNGKRRLSLSEFEKRLEGQSKGE